MNSKEDNRNKKSVFPIIMGCIWGGITVFIIWIILSIANYTPYYSANAEYYVNNIVSEEYGMLYLRMRPVFNSGIDLEEKTEFTELAAIAHYIEAAGQYRMYAENGQTKKAEIWKQKMDQALSSFGKLDFSAEKIDSFLGLQ